MRVTYIVVATVMLIGCGEPLPQEMTFAAVKKAYASCVNLGGKPYLVENQYTKEVYQVTCRYKEADL